MITVKCRATPDGTLAEILGTLGANCVVLVRTLEAQLQEASEDRYRRTASRSRILRKDMNLSPR